MTARLTGVPGGSLWMGGAMELVVAFCALRVKPLATRPRITQILHISKYAFPMDAEQGRCQTYNALRVEFQHWHERNRIEDSRFSTKNVADSTAANHMTLGEVIRDTARTAGAVVTGMSRAHIRKVTTTNHSFRISVGERANSSTNERDLIEHAIEKESIRLDVVGVDVRFHSS